MAKEKEHKTYPSSNTGMYPTEVEQDSTATQVKQEVKAEKKKETKLEPSGSSWCAKFPGSSSLDDLKSPFKENFTAFYNALIAAGISVTLNATYRPPERAYLMHWSWEIARNGLDASKVPAMDGVNIDWVGDTKTSKSRAEAMVTGYGLKVQAVLTSRHTEGNAVDMDLAGYEGKKVAKKGGVTVEIKQVADLYPIAETYDVHKLDSDKPHWSNDGH